MTRLVPVEVWPDRDRSSIRVAFMAPGLTTHVIGGIMASRKPFTLDRGSLTLVRMGRF